MRTERNASIELLRIAMMMLIVFTHLRWLYLPAENLSGVELSVWKFLALLCNFHVDVFVLITGYFGLRSVQQPFIKILSYSYFYILLLTAAFALINHTVDTDLLCFPITGSPWWFTRNYFLLILIAPILESAYRNQSVRNRTLITGTLTLINVYWSFWQHTEGLYNQGADIITFVNLYSVGQLLRTDSIRKRLSQRRLITYFLVLEAANVILALTQHTSYLPIDVLDYSNPITMALAAVLFILAINTRMKGSAAITWLAESAFAVYMITEFPQVRGILQQLVSETLPSNPWRHILYVPFFILLTYITCVLVDKIRIRLFRIIPYLNSKI